MPHNICYFITHVSTWYINPEKHGRWICGDPVHLWREFRPYCSRPDFTGGGPTLPPDSEIASKLYVLISKSVKGRPPEGTDLSLILQ
jgi:hypothetical protein